MDKLDGVTSRATLFDCLLDVGHELEGGRSLVLEGGEADGARDAGRRWGLRRCECGGKRQSGVAARWCSPLDGKVIVRLDDQVGRGGSIEKTVEGL